MQMALLLSTHATRDESGRYTPQAEAMLEATSRNLKLLQIVFWAGQTDEFKVLLEGDALKELEPAGVISASELAVLLAGTESTPRLRHDVVLGWLMMRALAGQSNGALRDSEAFSHEFTSQATRLHGTCGGIMDNQEDRMPLAYVHIVQVLIDSLMVLTPAALYPKVGVFSVPLAGLLTVFYRGLLELAKCFLDPFNGDDETDVNVNVLLAEANGLGRFAQTQTTLPDDLTGMSLK